MQSEDKVRRIKERAYEIYRLRDPDHGSADDDWCKAEAEIECEESLSFSQLGPARLKERSHWGKIGSHVGEDIENPA